MTTFFRTTLLVAASVALVWVGLPSQQTIAQPQEIKVGMIGPDTSHVTAFTKLLNDKPEETLEMMAFMEAADLSKARGGAPVALTEITQKN